MTRAAHGTTHHCLTLHALRHKRESQVCRTVCVAELQQMTMTAVTTRGLFLF